MTAVRHHRVEVSDPRKRADRSTGRIWRVEVRAGERHRTHHFRTKDEAKKYRDRLLEAKRQGKDFDPATCEPVDWGGGAGSTTMTAMDLAEDIARHLMSELKPSSRKSKVQRLSWAVVGLGPMPDGLTPKELYPVVVRHLRGSELSPVELDRVRRLQQVSLPLPLVTTEVVRDSIDRMRLTVAGRPASAQELHNRMGGLSHLLNEATDRGLVVGSPLRSYLEESRRTRGRQVDAGPTTVVSPVQIGEAAEVRALLKAAKLIDVEAWEVLSFIYRTGCRPGEAWGLEVADVRPNGSEVTLRRSRTAPGAEWADGQSDFVGPLKHRRDSEARVVPISDPGLRAALRARVQGATGAYVWEVSPDRVSRVFAEARNSVAKGWPAMKLARPYSLRHTHASLALNAGVPVTEVARRLGHKPETLLKVYAHVVESGAQKWSAAIQAALG